MTEPKRIRARIAIAIHDEAIYEFGGLAGIREHGLLESALDRPRNLLAYKPRSSIFELAAAVCFGVAKNHPFNDGNKRTALLSTRAFLYLNGRVLEPLQPDEVATMLAVAADALNEKQLAVWLRLNSRRA
ncbi:MAG: type II toxin-antitoxin system death-on-curing family toxin [Steroidobacteraceae bacterium]